MKKRIPLWGFFRGRGRIYSLFFMCLFLLHWRKYCKFALVITEQVLCCFAFFGKECAKPARAYVWNTRDYLNTCIIGLPIHTCGCFNP